MKQLLDVIERDLPAGGDWCTLLRAHTLAAIVVGLRPRIVLEIGVFRGGSLIPMALACKYNGTGKVIAIDPWSAEASIAGETEKNAAWWSTVNHEAIYQGFIERVNRHELASFVEIWRTRSDDARPPDVIDLLSIDGNHTEQATRDVMRYCPHVRLGGIAVLDDVEWEGGGVAAGVDKARAMGFVDLYPLDKGIVMQRRFGGPA